MWMGLAAGFKVDKVCFRFSAGFADMTSLITTLHSSSPGCTTHDRPSAHGNLQTMVSHIMWTAFDKSGHASIAETEETSTDGLLMATQFLGSPKTCKDSNFQDCPALQVWLWVGDLAGLTH